MSGSVIEKQYTWQEIAQHNTEKSVWVYVDDTVYDITRFTDRHPGGRDMILLMAGRDITDLIPSYHPFTDRPQQILQKFKIGKLKGSAEFGHYKKDSGFYTTLRKRVADYFKDNNIDYKNPYPGLLRWLLITVTIFLCWFLAVSQREWAFHYRLYLMIIAGIAQGLLLIHTMHDCSHAALSHQPWMWRWFGRITMDLTCGTSFDAWLHQHTVGHHVYTNVATIDPDVPSAMEGDVRRVLPHQKWSVAYSFQYVWLPILYSIYAFKNRWQDLSQTLFGGYNGCIRVNPHFRDSESFWRQLISKALWIIRAVIVPIYVYRNAIVTEFLPLFLVMELATGYWLTWNFQVSHISTAVDWPLAIKDDKTGRVTIGGEWGRLQVETCVDYGHQSWLCTFLSGALNYQSVHHLFPCVSQYHYPAIAPIIQKTAQQFGVRFNHFNTFTEAFGLHVKQLYDMSLNPDTKKHT